MTETDVTQGWILVSLILAVLALAGVVIVMALRMSFLRMALDSQARRMRALEERVARRTTVRPRD